MYAKVDCPTRKSIVVALRWQKSLVSGPKGFTEAGSWQARAQSFTANSLVPGSFPFVLPLDTGHQKNANTYLSGMCFLVRQWFPSGFNSIISEYFLNTSAKIC